MERGEVVKLALRLGWKRGGQFRRYGPNWFEAFRRGRQWCWIGFYTLESQPLVGLKNAAFVRSPLTYATARTEELILWLGNTVERRFQQEPLTDRQILKFEKAIAG